MVRGMNSRPSPPLAHWLAFTAVLTAAACAPANAPTESLPPPPPVVTPAPPTMDATSVVDAADRSADDRALDAGRKPKELLAFLGVTRGMKVGEIAAGTGYTTELLARAVGPEGKVYAENNRFVVEKFADKPWAARLAKHVNANVVRVDRELDAPFPPEVKDLDVVVDVLFYHDTVWMKTDRAAMNRAIFAALKPGGAYVIVDHSGRTGTGTTETDTLHRIEEKIVRDEVLAAGFVFEREGTFLKNDKDTRDWNASPRAAADKRGTSDRFALRFTKPR